MEFKPYDRLPVVHFGYFPGLLEKWENQGHLPEGFAQNVRSHSSLGISDRLIKAEIDNYFGWDFRIFDAVFANKAGAFDLLDPLFESKVVKILPDGNTHEITPDGVIIIQKYDANGNKVQSIPAHVGHTLTDRESWEKEYLPRLLWSEDRVNHERLKKLEQEAPEREDVICIYAGSIVGILRNYLGLEGMIMTQAMEPELFTEMVDTQAGLLYRLLEKALEYKIDFDYAYIWEDLTCSNGPLINPNLFEEVAGAHYRKITKLLRDHGVTNILVDSDGNPEKLMPVWVNNGINILWPIEYGKWHGDFIQHREEYGKRIKGIGGVRKQALAEDRAAVDKEIERIKPIVELGGYLPCPDHLLPLESEWDLVKYYAERMHEVFA